MIKICPVRMGCRVWTRSHPARTLSHPDTLKRQAIHESSGPKGPDSRDKLALSSALFCLLESINPCWLKASLFCVVLTLANKRYLTDTNLRK